MTPPSPVTFRYATGDPVRLGDLIRTGFRSHQGLVCPGRIDKIFQPGTEDAEDHSCEEGGGIFIEMARRDGKIGHVLEVPPDGASWEDLELIARDQGGVSWEVLERLAIEHERKNQLMARMEHFALFAADAIALKDFYVDVMGLRVVVDNGAGTPPGYFLADDGGMALEIIGRPPGVERPETRYGCHVAFLVKDLAAERARLESLGRVFEVETAVDTPEFETAFTRDPDGNRFQIAWRARPLGS